MKAIPGDQLACNAMFVLRVNVTNADYLPNSSTSISTSQPPVMLADLSQMFWQISTSPPVVVISCVDLPAWKAWPAMRRTSEYSRNPGNRKAEEAEEPGFPSA